MNGIVLKTSLCFVLMITFLIMAFVTKNMNASQLFVCLVIIIGALTAKHLSPKKSNLKTK
jgi:uncharacterized membrane protein